jgi:hypothetical protein
MVVDQVNVVVVLYSYPEKQRLHTKSYAASTFVRSLQLLQKKTNASETGYKMPTL